MLIDQRHPSAEPAAVLVCVIMPAFHAKRFILAAAHAVLSQSVTGIELIIVDDGSTDRTLEIARSIADRRVSVLTGPNGGRAHARNRALAAAKV